MLSGGIPPPPPLLPPPIGGTASDAVALLTYAVFAVAVGAVAAMAAATAAPPPPPLPLSMPPLPTPPPPSLLPMYTLYALGRTDPYTETNNKAGIEKCAFIKHVHKAMEVGSTVHAP